MTHWAMAVGTILAPVMAAAAIAGVLANVIQNKPGFTPAAIRPDFKKVSPIGGVKRLVGMQALMEFGKSILKIVDRRRRRRDGALARARPADARSTRCRPPRSAPTPPAWC